MGVWGTIALTQAWCSNIHSFLATNDAWVSINAPNPSKRSIGLAMAVMGSNLGAIAGGRLFRDDDAPRYTRAFVAILALYAGAMFVALLIIWVYWRAGRVLAKGEELKIHGQVIERPVDGRETL
ncbi:hypothetical protein F5883DRAFT_157543 [Diaporthe sp. PMI_573]|nr:hypothetical protein F5883DRAFT_157543 [Diaporthaceae sp. PMI_573]